MNTFRRLIHSSLYSQHASRTPHSLSSMKPAFVLDIDGVLMRGKHPIPSAIYTMQNLLHFESGLPKYPLLFMTNGGGHTERYRAHKLSSTFNVKIHPEQIILSHSPLQHLAQYYNQYSSTHSVLIIGHKNCAQVAASYGFQRPISSEDLAKCNPLSVPLSNHILDSTIEPHENPKIHFTHEYLETTSQLPVKAVFVMHDSHDWGRDIQLIVDVLTIQDARPSGTHSESQLDLNNSNKVEVYFCNPDFIWPNETNVARFGQGAFKSALKCVYKEYTGRELSYKQFGKPNLVQYEFVKKRLLELLKKNSGNYTEFDRIFAVGDNPAADVRGANSAGDEWVSVLVRTGCFTGKENDEFDRAQIVEDNIEHAVKKILETV